jgi:pyrimidine-nucleoside phosphorylase
MSRLWPAAGFVEKKRRGGEHSREEIEDFVAAYAAGRVEDAQATEWLRAVMQAGMSLDETAWLTDAMARSGRTLTWDPALGPIVDKHSTGGVGDDVSLIAVPLAAACGVKVAKLSGRALGHTGGTLDKLESIPGLSTTLSVDAFQRQVAEVGCAIAGASADLAPADKKLYALRHRTQTVASVPLIAASVLSKKIAGGAPNLVIDVKVGRCAFMRTVEEATQLARTIVEVGARLKRTTVALVTDMDAPLASSIGDTLELDEALRVLEGGEGGRLAELSLLVAGVMVDLAQGHTGEPRTSTQDMVREALLGGAALAKFEAMVQAQGGRLAAFPRPGRPHEVVAARASGVVEEIDGRAIGEAVVAAQAGLPKGSVFGVRLCRREGDEVTQGETLAEIYGAGVAEELTHKVRQAIRVGTRVPASRPLVFARLA